MSARREIEDRYTVKCRNCFRECIRPEKKPNQKWINPGACPHCRSTGIDVTIFMSHSEIIWADLLEALCLQAKQITKAILTYQPHKNKNKLQAIKVLILSLLFSLKKQDMDMRIIESRPEVKAYIEKLLGRQLAEITGKPQLR